jgi:predicted dehydrogenase
VAEIVLRTQSGAIGSIHLDYFRRVPERTLEITGEEGVVRADLNEQTVLVETPDETDHQQFDYTRDEVFCDQLAYFLEHVRSREPCHNDVAEAKRVLEIALEAKGTQA